MCAMPRYPKVDVFHRLPAQLGEGPCWHAARQTLWWVDILGRRYFEADLSGKAPRELTAPQVISAVAPTEKGGLVAAFQDGIHLVDPDVGSSAPFALPEEHDPKHFRFNDAKIDPRGRLWAGTAALDHRSGQSRLYRISSDRSVTVMRDDVSISNGLAWTPDGRTLYYIDSPTRTVQAFDFDLELGVTRRPRVAITFSESDGWPDGCCMDVEGCLWVAHWGGSKVTRWDPVAGRLLATFRLPVANVTSCAFGGAELDQLFITTAVEADRRDAEPEAGYLFWMNPGTTGVPLASFATGE